MGIEADPRLAPEAPAAEETPRSAPAPPPPRTKRRGPVDWVDEARTAAAAASDMGSLKAAVEAFEGCELKKSAIKTAVYDGVPGAPVMVVGEGPGAEEDRRGLPFVGKAGKLLDKMLAAIGLSRETNALITNVNYWRPPNNRNPEAGELAVCRPFVDRMIELNAPKLIIAAGGVPAVSLLGAKTGIMKLRGQIFDYETPGGWRGPLVPVFHPAFLLRRPQEKAAAWRDLQMIEAMLRQRGVGLEAQ